MLGKSGSGNLAKRCRAAGLGGEIAGRLYQPCRNGQMSPIVTGNEQATLAQQRDRGIRRLRSLGPAAKRSVAIGRQAEEAVALEIQEDGTASAEAPGEVVAQAQRHGEAREKGARR